MQPELTLFARMRQGDEEAFVALYRRHKDAVYRFALLRTGSAAHAADVTQETFLHLMTRPDQYDPARGSVAAWLCGVARNLARRASGGRGMRPTDDSPATRRCAESPAEALLANETAEQMRLALAAVAPRYRDVLILTELAELSPPRPRRSAASTSAMRSRLPGAPSSPIVFREWGC
jgi:RNA polymerase sigma-70 factor (ECF subfamily)